MGARAVFYALRLLWHPAPWSVALLWLALSRPGALRGLPRAELRALAFAAAFVGLSTGALLASSRVAERYAFPMAFAIGACGAVAARRAMPAVGRAIARADAAVPMLPVVVWMALVIARLVLGGAPPR
jgi:hypothetical protein